jgi:hypothetical protein
MSSIKETAEKFFDACETGKGWEGCQPYCHTGATFSAQAGALSGVDTLQAYTDWMKGLFIPVPDGRYEVRSFPSTRVATTSPHTESSAARTLARADRCRRRVSESRQTTST